MRLIYFDFAGRGEAIRDALRLGHVEFTDERVSYPEFLRMRTTGELPFDTLPVLVLDDGFVLGQSNTILRWAGRRAGLEPTQANDALRVDALLDLTEDFGGRVSVSIRVTDEAVRAHLRAELASRWLPEWLRHLERSLANAGEGWLVGSSLTVADLKVVHLLDKVINGSLSGLPTTLLDGFPTLVSWRDRVHAQRVQPI